MRRGRPMIVAVAVTIAACGGGSSSTTRFDVNGAGFTFDYPKALSGVPTAVTDEFKDRPPAFSRVLGSDPVNVLVVARYTLRRDYDAQTFTAFVDSAARAIARFGRAVVKGHRTAKVGGADAYIYDLQTTDGTRTTSLTFVFRGRSEYFMRCQWDAAGKATIPSACTEARSSFRISS